jgi:hypothetical protein
MIQKIGAVGILMLAAAILPTACTAEVDDPEPTETSQATDEPQEDTAEVEQAVCGPGFKSVCTGSGSRCLANCGGSSYWMDTGYALNGTPSCYKLVHGQCHDVAKDFCLFWVGKDFQGACWGHR